LNDVLKEDSRSQAQVQDNLYVAAANESDGGLIKALPKRFSQLVPKLKASDYDYVIFDLPPVTQTSITSKLAGFMDMVLLVVESEKTGRSIVAEATDLLRDSRATVATVLNKTQRYVPRWVHRDFE
jgi:MinD-like ATPase involved in chromosome partitioning or flagellar assembly